MVLIHGCLIAADAYTRRRKQEDGSDGNTLEYSIWHSISGMYAMISLIYFGHLAGRAHEDDTSIALKSATKSKPEQCKGKKKKNQHLTNLVNGVSALIADPCINTADTLAVFKEMTKLLEVVVDVEKGKVKLSKKEYEDKFGGILANLRLLNARIDDECEAQAATS